MPSNLENRLLGLESRCSPSDAVLHFEDGSTRRIRIRRQTRLALLLATFDEAASCDHPDQPRQAGRFDEAIHLFASAPAVESDDRLVRSVHGICRCASEKRQEEKNNHANENG
jgi:hypothetical protein